MVGGGATAAVLGGGSFAMFMLLCPLALLLLVF